MRRDFASLIWNFKGGRGKTRGSADFFERKFEAEKVRIAIKECGFDKARGPYGFSMAFFNDKWEVIKEKLKKIFNKFYKNEVVTRIVNKT